MFEAAFRRVIDKIDAAPTKRDPFPHIHVEEIFPAGFYGELLGHLPDSAAYQPLRESGRVTKDYSPHRLALFPADLDGLPTAGRAFWRSFFGILKKGLNRRDNAPKVQFCLIGSPPIDISSIPSPSSAGFTRGSHAGVQVPYMCLPYQFQSIRPRRRNGFRVANGASGFGSLPGPTTRTVITFSPTRNVLAADTGTYQPAAASERL